MEHGDKRSRDALPEGTRSGTRRLADPRRLGMAFVVGLVVLLAHNAYWLVRNQTQPSCRERLCVSPRSLERFARRSGDPRIVGLANNYFLRRKIPHTRLAVPRWFAGEKWNLEHLSRLRVEVSRDPFIIDPQHVERLRKTSTARRAWRRRKPAQVLYLRLDPRATEYVLAQTDEDHGPIFVMPRSEYAEVAARMTGP